MQPYLLARLLRLSSESVGVSCHPVQGLMSYGDLSPLLSGGIMASITALIGVIIGALASYLVGSAMERSRWQRQQAARWDEKRAEIYAEYGYSVKNIFDLCKRIAAHRGLETSSEPLDPADGLPELRGLTAERTAKWESVLLLGNPETIAAARAWHRNIWHMEYFARGIVTDNSEWIALLDEVTAARTRFYDAARSDLGITSGQVPPSSRWEGPHALDKASQSSSIRSDAG